MKKHLVLFLLLAGLLACVANAQPREYTFDHLTARDGLPDIAGGFSGGIRPVVQDTAGFMWFGGFGGLARYDGYDFTVFRHDPEDSTSLSGDRTTGLYLDRAGTLWVGTYDSGLNRFDETTGQFRRYLTGEDDVALGLDRVSSIYEDTRDTFWVGAGGFLLRLDRESGGYTRFLQAPDDPDKPRPGAVARIYEDHSGTLWVAKRQRPYGAPGAMDPGLGSLNRYDPQTETFISYTLDPTHANGLVDGRVGPLLEDRSGTFWVGTWGDGLHTMDRALGTFTHYAYDPAHPGRLSAPRLSAGAPAVAWRLGVMFIHEDRRGLIWIGAHEGGLNVYDPSTGRLTHFEYDPSDPNGLAANNVRGLYESRDGTLWLTYRNLPVVTRIYPARRRFVHHVSGAHPNSLGTGVYAFHEDREGAIRAVSDAGLDRLDPATGSLTHVPHEQARPDPVEGTNAVYYDLEGATWIGTWGNGLRRLDRASGRTTAYRHSPADPTSLSGDWVSTVYEDSGGTLWVGTFGQGLNRLDPGTGAFTRYAPPLSRDLRALVRTMDHYDAEGRSLAALLRMGSSVDTTATFELSEATPVLIAAQGEVRPQFGTGDGGWIEDAAGTVVWEMAFEEMLIGGPWRFKFYIATDTLGPGRYRARYQSDSSEDYTDNWSGNRVDYPERWGIQVYALPEVENPLHPMGDETPAARTVSGLNIGAVMEDRSGTLWVGTDFGVDRYDREADTFVHYPFPRTRMTAVTALYEDRRGGIWAGTYGDGLYRVDPSTGVTAKVDLGNDFESHDMIRSVIEDDDGYLWITSRGTLTRLDPETETARRFSQSDGVPQVDFWWGSAFKGSDGTLFFGGDGGFTSFRPDLMFNAEPPEVVLTRLWLFNDEVAPDEEGPLHEPLWQTRTLTLRHDQDVLTLDYAGLLFNDPGGVTYEYQLEGYDQDPVHARSQRSARYANLGPGDYTFHVKAANADGLWSEQEASIEITILSPWWRTNWAYMLYALLLIAAVVGTFRLQHKHIVRREKQKAHHALEEAYTRLDDSHHQLEEAHHDLEQTHRHLQATQQQLVHSEKMASLGALTAGIAHEIKNPLNFITGFAEVNVELADDLRQAWHNGKADIDELLDDLKRNAQVINQHGKRADAIVQSMMQHASGVSGEREATDVNALVGEYVDLAYHGKRAQTPGFNVTLERDLGAAVGRVEMVAAEIGRVVLNLLANAFDAVQETEKPKVTVRTRQIDGQVEIRVSDNGSGIPPDVRERIFEPFYTTKPAGSGTGLGLSLAYDIVTQGHGGVLASESTEGKETTFIIRLPADLA